MEHIEFLKEVAQELGQQNILNSLNAIQERTSQQNANLLIPLVGEFSSGKTTLLNALTDSKKLETATKPTTATIYEIHFGCNKFEANVVRRMDKLLILMIWEDLKMTSSQMHKL